jgi:hypothetical protein
MRLDALDVLFENSRHIFRKGSCVIISRYPVVNLQRLIATAAIVVMVIVLVLILVAVVVVL